VLYQQLLSGTRQLSNQEKRTLLYFGSLHAPAAALRQQAVLSAADELQGSDEEHLGSELDDDDGSSSSSSDDGSAAQHLPDQGDTWGSLGEEGLAEERVLTKRQVDWRALGSWRRVSMCAATRRHLAALCDALPCLPPHTAGLGCAGGAG
jgi:hypothetical protein